MDLFVDPPGPVEPAPGGEPDPAAPVEMLPGDVPLDMVIGRSERAEVVLAWVGGYPTGLQIRLSVRVFGSDPERDLASELLAPPDPLEMDEGWYRGRLTWGFEFADGGVATNVDDAQSWRDELESDSDGTEGRVGRWVGSARLGMTGGEGSRWAADLDYWLPGLPPPGVVRVICQWPAERITPTTRELDSAVFLDAAARARRI